ncbi:MAG: BatA domain-containing protein [Maribacter sp.]|uniref:BatA domain-containing protein n=1 Tax=Maribacter sp. TaxID=1897614 RepID=UPI003C73D2FA
MQFKYPEFLWALFLLLIPIFIHLFQLRRFKKTPFTNVKLLKKVVIESRKSNTLKKWLLLLTRLLLYTVLILAFAQPFLANKKALSAKETVIYLDNSFSMMARQLDVPLLNNAVQDLLKSIPEDQYFSLFTNTEEYRDIRVVDIQNELLNLPPTPLQLNLEEIQLKAGTLFSKRTNVIKNLIVVSDFQNRFALEHNTIDSTIQKHYVKLSGTDVENVSIDSCYIGKMGAENMDVNIVLSAPPTTQRTPISFYNGGKLIAKTAAIFDRGKSEVPFTLSISEVVNGKLAITDKGLPYDNHLYFNIDEKEKPKVLVIGDAPSEYLKKIYTDDEFIFTSFSLKNLNYRDLEGQNLILLNELENLPNSLISSIASYVTKGGDIVIIPSIDAEISSYNQLLTQLSLGSIVEKKGSENLITDIAFSHPLYDQVFEKTIRNFQFPKVNEYLTLKSNAPAILSFQNGDAFLIGDKGRYFYTAALGREHSNFQQSPLIVPTFLKMGTNSLKHAELYYLLKGPNFLDLPFTLAKDAILKVGKGNQEFIPLQQSHANKVSLTFDENPTEDGIYTISEKGTALKNISFNYPRSESALVYTDLNSLDASSRQNSISSLFSALENDNRITELWKWFVILALLFLMIEVLLIKFLK